MNRDRKKSMARDLMAQFYDLASDMLAEADVERIIATFIDRFIVFSKAERGMVILFDKNDRPLFQVARHFDRDIKHPEYEISRTIIDKVKREKAPLCLPNALEHDELDGSNSVARLKILSVMCFPLLHDRDCFGIVYLDNRSVRGIFKEAQFEAAKAFCDFIAPVAWRALECHNMRLRIESLETQLNRDIYFETIAGSDPVFINILKLVDRVADTDAPVIIQGESGTGKELIARALHQKSRRCDQPFIAINCAALPENLLESELFGHVKGAFTGAYKDKSGWFARADQGTIFLDEISDMSTALQVKLLRVLQFGEYSPVGASELCSCDIRVITASSQNLSMMVKEGKFRSELFYRLNVIEITLPSLRQRRDDIPILTRHFLNLYAPKYQKADVKISKAAQECLNAYAYPGNIRELENIVQRAIILCESDTILPAHLPEPVRSETAETDPVVDDQLDFRTAKQRSIERFEKAYLSRCLRKTGGNISKAAKLAGMHFKNFYTKVKAYGLGEDSND
jgi:transcriptional regulator with GAF, ATPase, and Fis domain